MVRTITGSLCLSIFGLALALGALAPLPSTQVLADESLCEVCEEDSNGELSCVEISSWLDSHNGSTDCTVGERCFLIWCWDTCSGPRNCILSVG